MVEQDWVEYKMTRMTGRIPRRNDSGSGAVGGSCKGWTHAQQYGGHMREN